MPARDLDRLELVVYNPTTGVIQTWTPELTTGTSSNVR